MNLRMSEMIVMLFGVGLTALSAAVGWLILRVLENSKDVAILQATLSEAQISDNFREVHGRITALSECTHKILGSVERSERITDRIHDCLMERAGSKVS